MPLIDEYLAKAGDGAVIMSTIEGLKELRAGTPAEFWSHDGRAYRDFPVEVHDEWTWGWKVRRADGSLVEGVPGD